MKRFIPLFAALLSGLLLFAAWPVSPFTALLFIGWIPLLWLESTGIRKRRFFGLVYIAMFVWNVATTWWIWNASAPGAVAAFIANSFLLCFPWLGFSIVRRKWGYGFGYLALVVFWMSFEYIHLQDWGLSWPWLTLGNAFATHPGWIQWYEITGTSGGTLWILLVNILLFQHLRANGAGARNYRFLAGGLAALALPIGISFLLQPKTYRPNAAAATVVVVQPNIDPYEKISTGTFEAQLDKLIRTSEAGIDSTTELVVWPETALYLDGGGMDETELQTRNNFLLKPFWAFLQRHPGISLFTGVESYRTFPAPTAQSKTYNGVHYESYNGAALLDSSGAHGFYHKSMLVPGVETLPWFLKFLDRWFEKFGGTTAGYARQSKRTPLPEKHNFVIAPSVCYESIYGEFMSKYIRNGANIICIITNDGWWKKTPGHKQHMNYARLRAIETRTWVARSANTGISCVIGPDGTVYNPQPYNSAAVIRAGIYPLPNHKTFYVRNGDWLSKLALAATAVFIMLGLFIKIRNRINRMQQKN